MTLALSTFLILLQQLQQVSLLNCQQNRTTAAATIRKVEPELTDKKVPSFDKIHGEFHKTASALVHVERNKYVVGAKRHRWTL